MKNRKIIAMLCAMAMLVTTLSSIFAVTAAAAPAVKINIADEADAEGNYLVTVGYDGFENAKVGTIEIHIPIPTTMTYVEKSAKALDVGMANYDSEKEEVIFAWGEGSPDKQLTATSKDLFTFKVTGLTAADELKVTDKTTNIIDYSQDELDGTTYAVGDESNPLSATPVEVPYEEQQGETQSAVNMTKVKNADGSYTVTVSYDMTNAKIAAPKIGTIEIHIPVADTVYVEKSAKALDVGMANYDSDKKEVVFAWGEGSPDKQLTVATKDLFTFDVKTADGVKLKPTSASVIDYSVDELDGIEYSMAAGSIFAAALKIPAAGEPEPTTEPSVEPSVAPSTEPTTEPSVAPSTEPTTEPSVAPSTAPSTAPTSSPDVKVPVKITVADTTTALGDKGYKVTLADITAETGAELPAKVDIVLQGYKKANAKGEAVGYVIITNVDTATMAGVEFEGYVAGAKGVSVNVINSANNKVVADKVVK